MGYNFPTEIAFVNLSLVETVFCSVNTMANSLVREVYRIMPVKYFYKIMHNNLFKDSWKLRHRKLS